MLIVISPAKTLDYSPLNTAIGFSEPSFIGKTESLVKEMRNYDPEMISSLMKISENLGFLNFERFQLDNLSIFQNPYDELRVY